MTGLSLIIVLINQYIYVHYTSVLIYIEESISIYDSLI